MASRNGWLAALATLAVAGTGCDGTTPAPLQPEDKPITASTTAGNAACGAPISPTTFWIRYLECGSVVQLSSAGLSSGHQSAVQAAAASWNGLIGAPGNNLPSFTVASSGIPVQVTNPTGACFDGEAVFSGGNTPTAISITGYPLPRSPCNSFYGIVLHEMSHFLGNPPTDPLPYGDGISDHCISVRKDGNALTSQMCVHDAEDIFAVYGLRDGAANRYKNVVTDIMISGAPLGSLVPGQQVQLTVDNLRFDDANLDFCFPPGGPLPSRGTRSSLALSPQASACNVAAGGSDATVVWSSDRADIVSIVESSALSVTIQGGQPGTTTLRARVESSEFDVSGQQPYRAGSRLTVTVAAATPAAIVIEAGGSQVATVGTLLPVSPRVRVTDASGHGLAGVTVSFAVQSGGGIVSPAAVITDTGGRASTAWTLGTTAGAGSISASVSGPGIAGNPAVFNATGTAGAAASMVISQGNGQAAAPNTVVPTPPGVSVRDAYGNGVGGRSVTFAVSGGGGSVNCGSGNVSSCTVTSGANGVAVAASWRLGAAAGPNQLTATSSGLAGSPAIFSATAATAAPPSNLQVVSCSQSVTAGKTYVSYGLAWTRGFPSDSTLIGESTSSSSSTATVIWRLPATTITKTVGPYLKTSTAPPRYVWVAHKSGAVQTVWVALNGTPLQPKLGCQV